MSRDVRMKFARSFGALEIAIVGEPPYVEIAATDHDGAVLSKVAFRAEELDRLVSGVQGCRHVLLGHPKHEAKGDGYACLKGSK